jgi:hypothetical protein
MSREGASGCACRSSINAQVQRIRVEIRLIDKNPLTSNRNERSAANHDSS